MVTISDYELYQVPPRWLFLKLETSDGEVGWGEPIVEGRAATVETAVEELMESYLLGEEPHDIQRHWQAMYRGGFYRGGPVLMSAIAGIDQALWDLKGKAVGEPVYELLGGRARDRVQIYQGVGGSSPEAAGERASQLVDEGLTALKTGIGGDGLRRVETPAAVDAMAEYFGAIREAVGDDVYVAVDFHGRVTKPLAKELIAALEPHDPMFFEEPVLSEQTATFADLAARTRVPIATGERMFSRWDFRPVLEAGGVDIVQPDLSHAGGITEVYKIAAMAETYDAALAPHCPLGPIAFASCIQTDVACPNAIIQEQSLGIHRPADSSGLEYLVASDPFGFEDGYVPAPTEPGLGIEVDEGVVEAKAADHGWHNPILHNPDGGITEW